MMIKFNVINVLFGYNTLEIVESSARLGGEYKNENDRNRAF